MAPIRMGRTVRDRLADRPRGLDTGLARAGVDLLRTLPRGSHRDVLLCTDLHAGNVLAAQREPLVARCIQESLGDDSMRPVARRLASAVL